MQRLIKKVLNCFRGRLYICPPAQTQGQRGKKEFQSWVREKGPGRIAANGFLYPQPQFGNFFSWVTILVLISCSFRPTAKMHLPQPIWQISLLESSGGAKDAQASFSATTEMEGVDTNLDLGYWRFTEKRQKWLKLLDLDTLKKATISLTLRLDPDSYAHRGDILNTFGNSLRFLIHPEHIILSLGYLNQNNELVRDRLEIRLDGVGPLSYDYYIDNRWHHVAFGYDLSHGEIWVSVDGKRIQSFRREIAPGRYLVNEKKQPSGRLLLSTDFNGDLADARVYHENLTILQLSHLHQNIRNEYRSLGEVVAWPEKILLEPGIDRLEFPPGHPLPKVSALEQLQRFPDPGYKPGHTLLPLYNWVNPSFLAGAGQAGVSSSEMIDTMVALQKELASRWNYMLVINNSKSARSSSTLSECVDELQATVNLANQHPEWPLAVTSLWAQTDVRILGHKQQGPYIFSRTLDESNYISNGKGDFFDRAGRISDRPQAGLTFNQALAFKDGQAQRVYFERLLTWLNRPIDMINENGEVPPLPHNAKLLDQDPHLQKAFSQQDADWDIFQAEQKLALRQAYADAFLSLPGLKNTRFSWYAVDGGPVDRFQWDPSREIHRPINGYHYSTPDFYPRWPYNWRRWRGPWRGWAWIEESRSQELAAGDRLFSPFIAAGWSANPEENIRPSQWLGLLKALGPLGAEFFYTGFFIESRGGKLPTLPLPSNYVWQLAMPAYAQAITSHYEEILRKGDLLRDSAGNPMLRLDAGDPRVLVTARKYQDQYVIAATIQPISNQKGNVSDAVSVTVDVDRTPLNLEARRQGSVYRWDRSTGKLWQLDQWHELGHPTHWKP